MAKKAYQPAVESGTATRDVTDGAGTTRTTLNPSYPAKTAVNPRIVVVACSGSIVETSVPPPPNPALVISIAYSTNGGGVWTDFIGPLGAGSLPTSGAVQLSGSFDMSQLRISARATVNDPGGPEDSGTATASVTDWHVEVATGMGVLEG